MSAENIMIEISWNIIWLISQSPSYSIKYNVYRRLSQWFCIQEISISLFNEGLLILSNALAHVNQKRNSTCHLLVTYRIATEGRRSMGIIRYGGTLFRILLLRCSDHPSLKNASWRRYWILRIPCLGRRKQDLEKYSGVGFAFQRRMEFRTAPNAHTTVVRSFIIKIWRRMWTNPQARCRSL